MKTAAAVTLARKFLTVLIMIAPRKSDGPRLGAALIICQINSTVVEGVFNDR
jgi:hypothetical protein